MNDRGFREAPRLSDLAAGLEILQKYWRSIQPPGPVVPTEQYNFAAEASPGHEEEGARGEVVVEGDGASEKPAAQSNDALRPCPFCGEPAFLTSNAHGSWGHCSEGCVDYGMPTEEWNTRPIEDSLRKEIASLQQRLAEEEQYAEELERRLRESEGKLCHEMESGGVRYESGRQEGWRMCKAAVVARIREHAERRPLYGHVLEDTALEIEEGVTIQQIAGMEYDLAFDRAQLRATVEHETAGRIADWIADQRSSETGALNATLTDLSDAIRQGFWREEQGDDWEEVYDAWKEGENWKWARRVVCELIQWSLELSAETDNYNIMMRPRFVELLALIDGAAKVRASKEGGEAHCNQE